MPDIALVNRLLILWFVTLAGALSGGVPAAQPQPEDAILSSLNIAVWPEYDAPAVLVIYDGTVSEDVSLPQQMELEIPAAAQVNAVAYLGPEGTLLNLPWELVETDRGQAVEFEVEARRFVVEYYADILTPPPDRSFGLELGTPATARQVILTVRQPERATNMTIVPPLTPVETDTLGNPQYRGDLGPLVGDDSVQVEVSYRKADDQPSATALEGEGDLEGASATTSVDWVPWLIGGLVGMMAVIGAVFLWTRQRSRRVPSRQARRRRSREAAAVGKAEPRPERGESADRFCPRCGARYEPSDRFCRSCGAPRR